MVISRQKETRSRDYPLLLSNDFNLSLCCTPQAFKQFKALHLYNLDDKHSTRLAFEPSTSDFQATTGPSEPDGVKSELGLGDSITIVLRIVETFRDREVVCSASDHQGHKFESCVWRAVLYNLSPCSV